MNSQIRKLSELFAEIVSLNQQVSMDLSEEKKIKNILNLRENKKLPVLAMNEYQKLLKEKEVLAVCLAEAILLIDHVRTGAYIPDDATTNSWEEVLKIKGDSEDGKR